MAQLRVMEWPGHGHPRVVGAPSDLADGWTWLDVVDAHSDDPEIDAALRGLDLDPLALRDAVDEHDLPKIDDFGHHLLIVLHGLAEDRIATYEVDCFVTDRHLVTVRRDESPAIDVLWDRLQRTPELATGGVDQLAARLADVLTRRLLAVLDAFDERIDGLVAAALEADPQVISDLTAIRFDLGAVRRIVHPQREVLDLLRRTTSGLVSDGGRRRFSDVFDVASRTAQGLDAARTALAETLDAYRGAEARQATDVSKVLTIYAAIMLPLSLIAGVFGMNFDNLPGAGSDAGLWLVLATMLIVALVSLGIFVTVGWIRRPSGRQAGSAVGRGLVEAARTPAQLVGAIFEISTMPIRSTNRASRAGRRSD